MLTAIKQQNASTLPFDNHLLDPSDGRGPYRRCAHDVEAQRAISVLVVTARFSSITWKQWGRAAICQC